MDAARAAGLGVGALRGQPAGPMGRFACWARGRTARAGDRPLSEGKSGASGQPQGRVSRAS
eukprot:6831542-Lingulodinium_polyedra.AAC.1